MTTHKNYFCLLIGMFCLALVPAHAAVRQVRHSPGSGQYGSIAAALAAANAGDTVEIIDNSAPFVELVNVQKNNITLQGQPGLNPRPTVKGDGTANPLDTGIGPVVFTYSNSDGLVVKNLIIDGTGSNVGVDSRFWNGAMFENCKIIGGANNAVRNQVNTTYKNCEITGGPYAIDHFFGGPLVIDGCQVTGGTDNGFAIGGGTVEIRNKSYLSTVGLSTLLVRDNFSSVTLTITDSIISNDGTRSGQNLIVINGPDTGFTGKGGSYVTIDNSDIIGSLASTPTKTGAGLLTNTRMSKLVVKDTIFYNIRSVAYAINGDLDGLTDGFEDFCVYKQAPNNLFDQNITPGANDLNLADTDPLYINPAAKDFRLLSDSLAAHCNSTGTPAYAGSQGPEQVAVNAARHWSIY